VQSDFNNDADFQNIVELRFTLGTAVNYLIIDDLNINAAITGGGDTTAPTASVTAATVNNLTSVTTSQSTETGTIYLVKSTVTVSNKTSLDNAVTAGTAKSATVSAAATNTTISTTSLTDGTYYVYAVDASSNVSARSTNAITLDSTAPTFDVAPATTTITTTGFTATSSLNESGTVYYVVVADNATAPTAAEVVAGTASGSGAALASGNGSASSGSFDEGFKGRVATYIERIQFRGEAPWTRSARTARVSI